MATHAVTNIRTRKQWAEVINTNWRKSIDAIFETGESLKTASEQLDNDEFARLITNDLDFTPSTANKLIKIVSNPVLHAPAQRAKLPASWAVLSELAPMNKDDLRWAIKRGLVGQSTGKRAARAIAGVANIEPGETYGVNARRDMLPSPTDATKIARETGRMVAASDGHVYSGATEEEGANHVRRRQQTYGAIDAINTLADCPLGAGDWIAQAEAHWLNGLDLGAIDAAIDWLTELRDALPETQGVVNGK